MDFDPERIAGNPFVAGLVGASIAAWKFMPGASNWERSFNALAGAATTWYVTPLLCDYLKVTAFSAVAGAGFLLGALSMSLLAAGLSAVRETKWADILTGWLARKKETP